MVDDITKKEKLDNLEKTLEDFKNSRNKEKEALNELSAKVLELLKGADRISVIPNILANIYESLEYEDNSNLSFSNQIMDWGTDHYIGRKVRASIPKLRALYNYCVDESYTLDNKYEFGGGDREVCYIPTETDSDGKKKYVLFFQNQNIKFVVVFEEGYFPNVQIREVYRDIFDEDEYVCVYNGDDYCESIEEIREALKGPRGLEMAMSGGLSGYADDFKGNKYPKRVSLKSMIKTNFGKGTPAFEYNDCRDTGHLLSLSSIGGAEVNNLSRARYAFDDVAYAIDRVPKSYFIAEKRDSKLDELFNF